MVLFENINVNQRVEVLLDGDIYSATVKYKGCINGVAGEWVGLELDTRGTESIPGFAVSLTTIPAAAINMEIDRIIF